MDIYGPQMRHSTTGSGRAILMCMIAYTCVFALSLSITYRKTP